MAWTATLIAADPQPENPQNIKAHVRLTDGVTTFDVFPIGNDLSATNLKRWLHTIIEKNLKERDIALPTLKELVGQSITVEAPPTPDAGLVQFVQRWNRLMTLKRLGSVDATLAGQQSTLQGQVETYLKANPTAIDSVR